jgi:hypothetical protein
MFARLVFLSALVSLVACKGAQGPAGADGITLTTKYSCRGSGTSGTSSFYFEHLVFVMSDSSVMTSCAIDIPAQQITAFNMYKPGTEGSRTGLCDVSADLDGTPDYGYWELTLNDAKTQSIATYVNTSSSENGHTFNLSCTQY